MKFNKALIQAMFIGLLTLILSTAVVLSAKADHEGGFEIGKKYNTDALCSNEIDAKKLSRAIALEGIDGYRGVMADKDIKCIELNKIQGAPKSIKVEMISKAWTVSTLESIEVQFWKVKLPGGAIMYTWTVNKKVAPSKSKSEGYKFDPNNREAEMWGGGNTHRAQYAPARIVKTRMFCGSIEAAKALSKVMSTEGIDGYIKKLSSRTIACVDSRVNKETPEFTTMVLDKRAWISTAVEGKNTIPIEWWEADIDGKTVWTYTVSSVAVITPKA